MDSCDLPHTMEFAGPMLNRVAASMDELGLPRESLLIGYVKYAYPNAHIIFGAEHPQQIVDNLRYWNMEFPEGFVERLRESFLDIEERILNPSLWPDIRQIRGLNS